MGEVAFVLVAVATAGAVYLALVRRGDATVATWFEDVGVAGALAGAVIVLVLVCVCVAVGGMFSGSGTH